jgi:hypothetical protein
MHFLLSAEVFSIFTIVTPIGKLPNKKAVKVSCLRLRPKDVLIFCIILLIPHYWALSNNLFYYNNLKELGPAQTAAGIFIDY